MSTLKTLVFFQNYEDRTSTNSPLRSPFKWTRQTDVLTTNALSETFQIAPGATQALFSGTRTLTQDGTTQYDLTAVPFTTSFYQLTNTGGTAPGFRTLRVIGTDATSQVTTSQNGPILTFTFSGGTLPSLGTVQVGDDVLIGNLFNQFNQGTWQIISMTTASISVVNPNGYTQGPITLASGFATQLRIFSSTGVQIGDTLAITSGFSPVSQNAYIVTQVTDYFVQFSYAGSLPQESAILTQVAAYSMAKNMIYMETDRKMTVLINDSLTGPQVVPVVSNGSVFPGMFLLNSGIYSLSVTNNSIATANVTLLSTE